MSANKEQKEQRANPLFANTSPHTEPAERRKIRPPDALGLSTPVPAESLPEPKPQPVVQQSEVPRSVRLPPPERERGEIPFSEFYSKKTVHFIPILLQQFESLAKKQHKSQTKLLNESIAALLDHYGVLDENTRHMLEEFGITLPEKEDL